MKKNSFSRQLRVSLKMINDVMILPLYPRAGKFTPPWSSCHIPSVLLLLPKTPLGGLSSVQGLLGGQGGSPALGWGQQCLGGRGRARTCPLPMHLWVLSHTQHLCQHFWGDFCPPQPQAQPLLPVVLCPFALSVPRYHSRAGGGAPG